MSMAYLKQLANEAAPINDADYGSNRQVNAENDFFDALGLYLANLPIKDQEAFDSYCTKATTVERINEGLRLAALANS